jgi:hypothetical protein
MLRAANEGIRTPPGADFHGLAEDGLLLLAPRTPAEKADEDAAAALHVRRLTNRHGCPGKCQRQEHPADVQFCLDWLMALKLMPDPVKAKRKRKESRGTAS